MVDIDSDRAVLENIDINIDIDKEILKNIDIDMAILQNIDIDKILYRLEFGISNTPTSPPSVSQSVSRQSFDTSLAWSLFCLAHIQY